MDWDMYRLDTLTRLQFNPGFGVCVWNKGTSKRKSAAVEVKSKALRISYCIISVSAP